MSEHQIAWAAGIFEGEGSLCWMQNTAVKLSVEMCDLDVLEKFQQAVGAGKIIHLRPRWNQKPQWRQKYLLQIYGRDDVRRVLNEFMPYLCSRRRAKAEEALERLAKNAGRHIDKTHCINGHAFTEENIYRAPGAPGWRKCRTCHRDKERARYHRLKGQPA